MLQLATDSTGLPEDEAFQSWIDAALECAGNRSDLPDCVTIRLVDEAESGALNSSFRDVPRATNVLAFPAASGGFSELAGEEAELGDLVICAPVVAREAREQAKTATAHFAHMVVHGCLHLLGYDHMNDQEAGEMESLEKLALERLGFPDPYINDDQGVQQA